MLAERLRPAFRVGLVVTALCTGTALCADGNVNAFLDQDGVLVVIGDGHANNVLICFGDCPGGAPTGAVSVSSMLGMPETTVNGQPGFPGVFFFPTAERIRVQARGGDDRIEVHPPFRWSLDLDGGPGSDVLLIDGDPGRVRLTGGPGDDLFSLVEGISISSDVFIDGGDGADSVSAGFANFCRESGAFRARLGPGNDRFRFSEDVTCHGPFSADLGPGADEVELSEQISFVAELVLATAAGADTVTFEDVLASAAVVVTTGAGDDSLSFTSTTVSGSTRLNGGAGVDELIDGGGNSFATAPETTGFEVFSGP